MRAVRAQSTVPGKTSGKWYPSIAGKCEQFLASVVLGAWCLGAQCSAVQRRRGTEEQNNKTVNTLLTVWLLPPGCVFRHRSRQRPRDKRPIIT